MKSLAWILCSALVLGCGAGEYGYSRTYTPLGAEEDAAKGAVEFDPVMVRRQPDRWVDKKISVFGIVLARDDAKDGADLVLQVRTLEPRNLCSDASSSSCRTTVSENAYDRIRVHVNIQDPKDLTGERAIGQGSLLRVVGKLAKSPDQGGVTIDAAYYRHWPRGEYVTTAQQGVMRR